MITVEKACRLGGPPDGWASYGCDDSDDESGNIRGWESGGSGGWLPREDGSHYHSPRGDGCEATGGESYDGAACDDQRNDWRGGHRQALRTS